VRVEEGRGQEKKKKKNTAEMRCVCIHAMHADAFGYIGTRKAHTHTLSLPDARTAQGTETRDKATCEELFATATRRLSARHRTSRISSLLPCVCGCVCVVCVVCLCVFVKKVKESEKHAQE
jgi:hypothetical protein